MNKKKFMKILSFAAVFIVLVFALLAIFTIVKSSSIDKQIAAFEAKRKIPDSENAAVIYEKLFTDANFIEILGDNIYKQMTLGEVCYRPWKSKDFPLEAEFLKKSKIVFPMFNEIAKCDKCFFSVLDIQKSMDILREVRHWAQFLRISANNDIGDERFNEAIEKSRLMLKIADHFQKQPIITYYLVGIAIEALSLRCTKSIILDPNISENQLQLIEKLPLKMEDDWSSIVPQILEGENYYARKVLQNYPFLTRFIMILRSKSITESTLETTKKIHLRLLADKRGNRILIALRRYKNQNNRWPEKLEQIKTFADPNVLVDPQNSGSFVYKRTGDSFILYSKGLNNIDEGGSRDSPADDWTIWPPP